MKKRSSSEAPGSSGRLAARPLLAASPRGPTRAFTLIELMICLSVVFVLTFLALPVMGAHGARKTRTIVCMDNLRRLSLAWVQFANDNLEVLPHNFMGDPAAGKVGWASGWLDWEASGNNTNVAFVIDARYAQLAPYVRGDSSLYRCPEDNYVSAAQRRKGWKARIRSYSADMVIGMASADLPTIARTALVSVTNMSGFIKPGPAASWVFIEEHPDSINDSSFFVPDPAFGYGWIEVPASHHSSAANVTFGDGHVEPHFWESSNTVAKVTFSFPAKARARVNPDIDWLRAHIPTR